MARRYNRWNTGSPLKDTIAERMFGSYQTKQEAMMACLVALFRRVLPAMLAEPRVTEVERGHLARLAELAAGPDEPTPWSAIQHELDALDTFLNRVGPHLATDDTAFVADQRLVEILRDTVADRRDLAVWRLARSEPINELPA